MKNIKIILSLFIAVLTLNMFAQDGKQEDNKKYPEITFSKKVHDFGDLKEGDVVETTFSFKNTGDAPLIMTKIKASCGCTIPSNWKKTPIMPGETSSFTVKFNSKNKPNRQSKKIRITSNTKNNNEYVTIKAIVEPDPVLAKAREDRMKQWRERKEANKKSKELKKSNATKSSNKSLK